MDIKGDWKKRAVSGLMVLAMALSLLPTSILAADTRSVTDNAIKNGSFEANSSWKYLQNCCVPSEPAEQSVSVMLALTELFLAKIGKGACRVHGGGFAGVIMCILPREAADVYREYISAYAGCDNVFPVTIRSQGAIHLG